MSYLNAQVITEIIMFARSGKIDLVDMKAHLHLLFEKERGNSHLFSTNYSGGVIEMLRVLFLKVLELNMGKTRPFSRAVFQVFKDEVNILQSSNININYNLTDVLRRFLETYTHLDDLEMDNEHSNELLLFVIGKGLMNLETISSRYLRVFNPTIVSFAKI